MTRPASLGDEVTEYVTVSETYPMPSGRKSLLASIETILSGGGVQRLTIELGKPIKIRRSVPKTDQLPTSNEVIDDDLFLATRNNEMVVLDYDDKEHPLAYLCRAFSTVAMRGWRPRAVLVPTKLQLVKWLNVGIGPNTEIFGVELLENKNIPDDALLLVASVKDDPETIVASVRLEMNLPRSKQ